MFRNRKIKNARKEVESIIEIIRELPKESREYTLMQTTKIFDQMLYANPSVMEDIFIKGHEDKKLMKIAFRYLDGVRRKAISFGQDERSGMVAIWVQTLRAITMPENKEYIKKLWEVFIKDIDESYTIDLPNGFYETILK